MSTEAPAVETDVLVVGSGPAGASAPLFLATYGTRTLLVTRYGSLSDTPRAHITNQRAMEVLLSSDDIRADRPGFPGWEFHLRHETR